MAEKRPTTYSDLFDLIFEEIRKIKKSLSTPRTRVQIESWDLTEDDSGNLTLKNTVTGTTYVLSAAGPGGTLTP